MELLRRTMNPISTKTSRKNKKRNERARYKRYLARQEKAEAAKKAESNLTIYIRDGRHQNSKCKGRTNILQHQEQLSKIPLLEAIANKEVFSFDIPNTAEWKELQAYIHAKMGIPICNQRLILGQRELTSPYYKGEGIIACLPIYANSINPHLWVFDVQDHDNQQIEEMTTLLHWETASKVCSYNSPYGREFKDFDSPVQEVDQSISSGRDERESFSSGVISLFLSIC